MKRKRRTEVLIKGSISLAEKLAKEIEEKYEVSTIQEPTCGLVMIKMRENSKNSLFYLGEVVVTETKVKINNSLGLGIVRENQPELSYYLAVIDGAYNGDLDETYKWKELLIEEELKIKEQERYYMRNLLKTKVNFETMDI